MAPLLYEAVTPRRPGLFPSTLPCAIEFTSVVFLALGDVSSLVTNKVSLDTRHVLQQTFTILSHALPAELNAKMRLDQTDTLMNISDVTSSLTAEMYRRILRVWMKSLWHFTREYNEPSSSVPLPSYVSIAFTNPEMTRRILREHRDPTVRMIGHCIEALVVNKLAADINSRTIAPSEAELAHPGAIEFTSVVFLELGDVGSLATNKMPLDTRHILQQTLDIIFRVLPAGLKVKIMQMS
ncbi:hypothetical protein EDB84DRAFT_1566332 [Lactarius hengduanensis]|nr:hypothetical protein EDB84DRAFT_1566332 [Lactarius hengduanensis]